MVPVRLAYGLPKVVDEETDKIANYLAQTLPKDQLAILAANYLQTLRNNCPDYIYIDMETKLNPKPAEKLKKQLSFYPQDYEKKLLKKKISEDQI